jgi:hypothetical protein
MSRTLRSWTIALLAALWLTGIVWIVLHYAFPGQSDFGPTPNTWEPATLRVHGVIAFFGVFLLGFLTARHVTETWRRPRNRASGIALVVAYAVLALSGYALYYVTLDSAHLVVAKIHEIVGVAGIFAALIHWLGKSREQK